MRFFVRHLAEDLPAHRRAGRVVRAFTDPGMSRRSLSQHCEVGSRLAARVGLGESVCQALAHAYERWDGRGYPNGLSGDEVPIAVRVVSVARDAELWARRFGWPATLEVLEHRRGHGYDPAVVDIVVEGGREWLGDVGDDPYPAVVDAEPAPVAMIGPDGLDAALAALADFTDIKSPWLRGHSPGVAELVVAAAGTLNQLGGRFLTDFYVMVAHWVAWATELVESWPDDVRDALFDIEQGVESARRAESIAAILRFGTMRSWPAS